LSRVLGPSTNPADPASRIAALERIVLDLMMEIEALRTALIEGTTGAQSARLDEDALVDDPHGVPGPHTVYGKAYLKTAWLTHWSAGASSGFDKLLAMFYPRGVHPAWRECGILKRLGYSDEAIGRYRENASSAETCT
jgi:hypothetical protein